MAIYLAPAQVVGLVGQWIVAAVETFARGALGMSELGKSLKLC